MRASEMGDSGAPLLRAEGLARSYGGRVALAGLSFEVARGEIFGFLGPNGAGKSTAFHLLAGLLDPDGGEIRFRGARATPRDAAFRACIGVVFQSPSVDLLLTGRENLRLGAMLYGLRGRDARARIAEALDLVELAGRADERVATYSGGMRRRLEIARVLLHRPELLIMDEPGQGLDLATLRRLWTHLRGLASERGLAILLTTHSPDEAEFCDRLAVLDGGRIVAAGTPEELKRQLGGDVLTIEAADGDPAGLAAELATRFSLEARVVDGAVMIEQPRGHELIPRLVESLPPGRLRSLAMRPPTLGDVFAHLTGRPL